MVYCVLDRKQELDECIYNSVPRYNRLRYNFSLFRPLSLIVIAWIDHGRLSTLLLLVKDWKELMEVVKLLAHAVVFQLLLLHAVVFQLLLLLLVVTAHPVSYRLLRSRITGVSRPLLRPHQTGVSHLLPRSSRSGLGGPSSRGARVGSE